MSSLNLDSETPGEESLGAKSALVILGSLAFSFCVSFLLVRGYMPPAARLGYAFGQTIVTAILFGIAFLIVWAIKKREWHAS